MTDWRIVAAVVFAYLATNLVVGIRAGRGSTDTVAGYVAGDRGFGTVVMYFVTGATSFSAFAFLGGPGWTFGRGAAAFYILAYGVLGIAPFFFLGPWAARLGRRHGYVTQASMLAHRFDSDSVAITAGVVSVIATIPYVTLQIQGAGLVFDRVTDGHIPPALGGAIAYGVVLVYVWKSGVMGVGWTNVLQGVFMLAIAWTLGLLIPFKVYGGVQPMFEQINAARPELLLAPGLTGSGEPWTPGGFSSSILVSAIGFFMWPHLFMKAFAAKNDRTIRRTVLLFPTFQAFLLPVFLVGFAGILYPDPPAQADQIMPHIILTSGLPAIVVGLFCAGALAASMSTGDALVHGAGSMAIEDVYRRASGRTFDQHTTRAVIRGVAVAVGIIGYAFAIVAMDRGISLVALLLMAYGAIVQLAPAVYGSFLWRRATGRGAVAGLVGGVGTAILLVIWPELRPWGLHEGLVGLGVNIALFVTVSLLTRPPSSAHVSTWIATARTGD